MTLADRLRARAATAQRNADALVLEHQYAEALICEAKRDAFRLAAEDAERMGDMADDLDAMAQKLSDGCDHFDAINCIRLAADIIRADRA